MRTLSTLIVVFTATLATITQAAVFGPMDQASGPRFGATLAAAVRKFQATHGMKEDGIVRADELKALNVPAQDRLEQLQKNVDRVGKLQLDTSQRYVLVNIPDFSLRCVGGD